MTGVHKLQRLSTMIRRFILESTTAAGSGHPSSSLSAVELMTGLMFGGIFRADLNKPQALNNDQLVFSKGHAAPLLYSLYAAAGKISEPALLTLRNFNSPLEGHPTVRFPYVSVPTGSLGQGLSVGVGLALAARLAKSPSRTYVLLGDSEMAEGQVWEAMQVAAKYSLDTLTAIIDINRLGQSGPTMLGHNVETYARRVRSFGWQAIIVNGHDISAVLKAYQRALRSRGRPTAILAKTIKGQGVAMMANKEGWHGRALTPAQLNTALVALPSGKFVSGMVGRPHRFTQKITSRRPVTQPNYPKGKLIAPRQAFGQALIRLAPKFPQFVVVDGEVKNSTYTEYFSDKFPKRFFQSFIAEQHMVSMATGMASRGLLPVSATFAAFLTRAHDQLRMAQYAGYHQVFAGTHAGVSIGQDGPSQMGLEDIAMFRTLGAMVLYPADAWAAERLTEQALTASGLVYLRLTRQSVPQLYGKNTPFVVGGSHTLRRSPKDRVTIVAAGITVYEAMKAATLLAQQKISVRVIDAYSIQPLDVTTLKRAAKETKHLIVVEDHRPAGGLGEAVRSALGPLAGVVTSLAVTKTPRSGTPEELLRYEKIDAKAIMDITRVLLKNR